MMKILCPLILLMLAPSLQLASHILLLMLACTVSMVTLFSPLLSPPWVSQHFFSDSLSSPLLLLTLWLTALMFMASQSTSQSSPLNPRFIQLIILLALTLILAFLSHQLITFYIFFELSLPPILLLILLWGYQPERLQAGMSLMLYTISASLPLLTAIIILKVSSGSTFVLLNFWSPPFFNNMLTLWWLATILAFMVKLPIYITHLWLPKAHVEAPMAGSMILAGVLLKLGSYGLLRVSSLFPSLNLPYISVLSPLALWGAVMTSLVCLRQTDMKALIAYSSVGHMGMILAAILSNSTWGMQGALAMSVAHGLCSSALFAAAGFKYNSLNTRSLFLTKGLLALSPFMMLWWFLLCIVNMAAPPSLNLLSEILLISASVYTSSPLMAPLMLISFFTAAYSLILFSLTSHGPPNPFTTSIPPTTSLQHQVLFLHLLPLVLLTATPMISVLW